MTKNKTLLLVSGSDPTGGAGIGADIGVARLMQCYPMPVISCITSQYSKGFRMMQPVDIEIFKDQLEAVLSEVRPDAVKVGMLPSADHMKVLSEMLSIYPHGPVVFDPIKAPSKDLFGFDTDWWKNLTVLIPFMNQTFLVTPNLPELESIVENIQESGLLDLPDSPDFPDIKSTTIYKMHLMRIFYGVDNILLTGGHNEGEDLHTDVLMCAKNPDEIPQEIIDRIEIPDDIEGEHQAYEIGMLKGDVIETPNTHGTGCVYSTSIASLLAQGMRIEIAVALAKQFVSILLNAGKDWRLYKDQNAYGPAYSILPAVENNTYQGFPLNLNPEIMN